MNLESLKSERDAIALQFEQQTKIRNDAESEQIRLQGAYRTLVKLIDDEESKPKKKGPK